MLKKNYKDALLETDKLVKFLQAQFGQIPFEASLVSGLKSKNLSEFIGHYWGNFATEKILEFELAEIEKKGERHGNNN
jgi:hypothetical protein